MPNPHRITYHEKCVYILVPDSDTAIENIRTRLRDNPNIDFKNTSIMGRVADTLTGGFISSIVNDIRRNAPKQIFPTSTNADYLPDSNFKIHRILCNSENAAKKLSQEITNMADLDIKVMAAETYPQIFITKEELKLNKHANPQGFSAPTNDTVLFIGSVLDGVKGKGLDDFYNFLNDIAKLMPKKTPERKYLLQLSKSAGDYSKLPPEAAKYFRDTIAPWITRNFSLTDTMPFIVGAVEEPRTDEMQPPDIILQIASRPEIYEQLRINPEQEKLVI